MTKPVYFGDHRENPAERTFAPHLTVKAFLPEMPNEFSVQEMMSAIGSHLTPEADNTAFNAEEIYNLLSAYSTSNYDVNVTEATPYDYPYEHGYENARFKKK